MADRDAYHAQSLQIWGEMASGWEARRDWLAVHTGLVNDWIVDKIDPQPGQVVLDLAAGPGELGFRFSERVGPDGRVLLTDFAPQMVEAARRYGDARGLRNIEYRVLDAADRRAHGVDRRFLLRLLSHVLGVGRPVRLRPVAPRRR